ncbi:MAG: BTAD domain-containing putative transcriptional regulator [Thioalkalispiraceae bacterium]|jgi:DNA-binding SARP family transcriptional activator
MAILQIRLLGGYNLFSASGETIDLRVKKVMALFAYLAIQPEADFSRRQLAQIFWPNTTEKHARQSLRQALADIRKHLPDFEKILDITHNKVNINHDKLDVDVVTFTQAAKIHDFASQENAYQLYRGRFLDGFGIRSEPFTLWQEEVTLQLHERYIHVVEFLAEHNLLEGKTDKAIKLNRELVQLDPIRESAHRCLISLYANTNQPDQAETQYKQCCNILRERLDTTPEERTTRTYLRIKQQVEEIKHPVNEPSTRLITGLKPGRENELSAIAKLLSTFKLDQQGQVIFITGENGVGKTWLLKQTADIAKQLDFKTAYTCFFNVKFSHENGIRDLLIEISDSDPGTDYKEIPELITNRFFENSSRYDLYLSILSIIFDLPLAKHLQRIYSRLSPDNREYLHTQVIVDILKNIISENKLILFFDDIELALPRHMSILQSLAEQSAASKIFLVFASANPDVLKAFQSNSTILKRFYLKQIDEPRLSELFPLESKKYSQDLVYLQWAQRLEQTGCFDFQNNLVSVIRRYLVQLQKTDRSALQVCATLGMRFSLNALTSILDDPHYRPANLINAGYIVQHNNLFEFSHLQIQQCIYQLIDQNQRKSLHSQAASYYMFGNSHLYAYHLEAAGHPGAAKAYLSAAMAAKEEFRLDFSSYFFDKAHALASDKDEKYLVAVKKGEMLLGSQRVANAIQSFELAQRLTSKSQQQAQAWLGMAIGLIQRKQFLAAKGLLDRCDAILTKKINPVNSDEISPDHKTLSRYYYYRALTAANIDTLDTARHFIKISVEHAKQSKSSYWLTNSALLGADIEIDSLHISEARDQLEIATRLAREHNLGYLDLQSTLSLAKVNLLQADFNLCNDNLEQIINQATPISDHETILNTLSVLCVSDLYKGQFSQLLQHTELALDLCKKLDSVVQKQYIQNYRQLALYYLDKNSQHDNAAANTLTDIIVDPESGLPSPSKRSQTWNTDPVFALLEENPEAAGEHLVKTKSLVNQLNGPGKLECCFIAIEAAIKHKLWEYAEDLADEMIMALKDEPLTFFIMCAERVRILSQIDQGLINHSTRTELVDILTSAKQYGLAIHLPAYEQALETLRHSKEIV